MENKKILDKIRKLLAHQKSAEKLGSIEEADTFAAKIQELITTYNLSLDSITEEEMGVNVKKFTMSSSIPSVSDTLGYFIMKNICKHNFCRAYKTNGGKMMIVGLQHNIDFCVETYSYLMPTYKEIGKSKFDPKYGTKIDTYLRKFLQGCADGLNAKLESTKVKNIQTTALVVTTDAVIKKFVEENMGNVKTTKKTVIRGGVYRSGFQTGLTVDKKQLK